jgi:hypothetical protein
MRLSHLAIIGVLLALFLAACASKEEKEEQPNTADAVAGGEATSAPAELLKVVDHKASGDYVVTLLNETGAISEGANRFTLEFTHGSGPDKQPVAVQNLLVELRLEMEGMAPMAGATSVVPAHDMTGRYNVASSRSAMPGLWRLVVTFDTGQRVEFTSTIHGR